MDPTRKDRMAASQPEERSAPSHEDIARRAHEIWRARGGASGRDLEDWLQAERELHEGQQAARSKAKRGIHPITPPRERQPKEAET